jgi:hypothetical protein
LLTFRLKISEADEIWGFVGKKEKQLTPRRRSQCVLFCDHRAQHELVVNFALGKRNQATADIFIEGLRHATARGTFQITADGFVPYVSAIENTLADRASFSELIKFYRATPERTQIFAR